MGEKIDLPQVDLSSQATKSQGRGRGRGRAHARTFRKSREKTYNHEFQIYLVNSWRLPQLLLS